MTTEPSPPFRSLEDRAADTLPFDAPKDRISLRNYICAAEIGAFQQERGVTQRLQTSVVVEVRGAAESVRDDVDRILSYDTLVAAVDATLAEERLNLLETFADRVAARVLSEPRAARVFVRVEKLDRGPFQLGIEIVRDKSRAGAGTEPALTAKAPLIVFVSNAAIAEARLPQWLDQLEALGLPILLAVDQGMATPPVSAVRSAQRRIDLLALEQNAWVLAGRDPRCLVVESRTEIDWAAGRGQTVVWAPSKMVLDAAPGEATVGTPQALVLWLAKHLGAEPPLGLGLSGEGLRHVALADRLDLPLAPGSPLGPQ